MIDQLPLHDNAVGVLDSSDDLTFDTLAEALAGRQSWVLPEFLDRLRQNGADDEDMVSGFLCRRVD